MLLSRVKMKCMLQRQVQSQSSLCDAPLVQTPLPTHTHTCQGNLFT